jgi:hypothetical protein
MIRQEQNTRIVAAYHKMPLEGRKALDRIVRKLTGVHGALSKMTEPATNQDVGRAIKQPEKAAKAIKGKTI